MDNYDLMLLLDADLSDERRTEIIEDAQKLIEGGGGKVSKSDPWGPRKLAYEIDHRKEAVYHLFQFQAEPASIADLNGKLRIAEGILRFRTLNPRAAKVEQV